MKTNVIIVNVIFLIGLIPAGFGALMSAFLFDAPGSESNTRTWALAGSLVALPVLIVITQIISWVAFSKQNFDLALKINALPTIDFVLIIFLFASIGNFSGK
jgi:membrane protease YdiL (CAAX protease family)